MSKTKYRVSLFGRGKERKPFFKASIVETEEEGVYTCCLKGEKCSLKMIQSLKEEVDELCSRLELKLRKERIDPDLN